MTHDQAETAAALETLTAFTAALSWDDVPQTIQRRAGLIFLDDLGAMVAARHEPELIALRAQLAETAGPGSASVLDGSGAHLDRYSAALGNGSAADWCELDGGFRPVVCHAALYCLPAILAEGEDRGHSLRDMLLALVAGYETVARVALAFAFPALRLHPHGGLATIGAAAAIAKLRGYSATSTARTIQSAATMVLPGPFSHAVEGALVRNVWPGLCAQMGMRAADWAAIGIAGTGDSLHLVLSDIFGATVRPEAVTEGLGRDWAMAQGYQKLHACCQYGHSTVEAVIAALEGAEPVPAGQIDRIEVALHPLGCKLDNAQPATTLAAKFSIQHIAAVTAVFGHAGAAAFHADTLADRALAALRDRVVLTPYPAKLPPPNDRPAHVRIWLGDGRYLSAECLSARGGADRPFPPEVIVAKAWANLAEAYPEAAECLSGVPQAEAGLLDQCWADILGGHCHVNQLAME